jgi:hypothetical protein
MNKSLAQMNKSREGAQATKRRGRKSGKGPMFDPLCQLAPGGRHALVYNRESSMKKLLLATAAALALAMPAYAAMSKDDIAKLPQDKVAAIKRYCTHLYPDGEFKMRLFCEDQEYKALQTLIERDR